MSDVTWQDEMRVLHANFLADMKMNKADPHHLYFLVLALCGEAGELANIVKKDWRGYNGYQFDRNEVIKEVADIMIYLQLIAEYLGTTLDSACTLKMAELNERWPDLASKAID